jgi:peptidyl-prolyl cis-trans isomerase C
MKRTLLAASLFALSSALITAPALAAKPAKEVKESSGAVASVNGKAISSKLADAIAAGQAAQGRPDSAELRTQIRDELIQREIVSQTAAAAGIDKEPLVQAQIELARQNVLISAYLGDYARKHPVSDEAIKKEYENIKAQRGDKEYKARHILVKEEAAAKGIIEKLKKGERFDDLAKQSEDPGSKDKGGDLGWSEPGNYVPPFAAALAKLEKNKFTETPVKTDFGWHVILLDDTRKLEMPPLDDVKGQIGQMLMQAQVAKHMQELRAKAKVK